jgi:magnesium chelatase family protein
LVAFTWLLSSNFRTQSNCSTKSISKQILSANKKIILRKKMFALHHEHVRESITGGRSSLFSSSLKTFIRHSSCAGWTMNFFSVKAAGVAGDSVVLIDVECVQQRRLLFLQIIGLPAGAAAAQRERVMAALESAGFRLPSRRVTVSLSGAAELRFPESTDLAVALAILGSARRLPAGPAVACGGLSLEGKILPLPFRSPLRAWVAGGRRPPLLLAWEDSQVLGERNEGGGFRSLREVVEFLGAGQVSGPRMPVGSGAQTAADGASWTSLESPLAQRVLQVSAAGGHALLLTGGDPGQSRRMAEALHSLLPPCSEGTREEVDAIHRLMGEGVLEGRRPIRQVRADQAGRLMRQDPRTGLWGELSLAHGGVLFLSDLGEKPASLLARLQEPLEQGSIRAIRGGRMQRQRADWLLIAHGQLCPCGEARGGGCDCAPSDRSAVVSVTHLSPCGWNLPTWLSISPATQIGSARRALIEAKAEVQGSRDKPPCFEARAPTLDFV